MALFDDPGTLGVFIPIVALCIPIVAIWTKHRIQIEQLRLQRGGDTSRLAADVEQLRDDVKELKEHLHQQMIAVDNLLSNQERILAGAKSSESLEDRLGIGSG